MSIICSSVEDKGNLGSTGNSRYIKPLIVWSLVCVCVCVCVREWPFANLSSNIDHSQGCCFAASLLGCHGNEPTA